MAQGPLMPTSGPAPTMKSLDQVEARTPISASFTITTSGSYYLTKNILVGNGNAIVISADNVTLDLNGFNISSTQSPAGTGAGVLVSSRRNVTIMNGSISGGVTRTGGSYSGTGFGQGITAGNLLSGRVSGVSVTGILNDGIHLYSGSTCLVENCVVDTVGGYGIVAALVSNSMAVNIGSTGIYGGRIDGCSASSYTDSGISAGEVSNSFASSAGATTPAILGTTVQNCVGIGAGDCGVRASNVENCYGTTTGSSSGGGVYGIAVNNSRGDSSGSCAGLRADVVVNNSYGYNSSSGPGLVGGNVQNCSGYAAGNAVGLTAELATNCKGFSNSADGISADVANGCKGISNVYSGTNSPGSGISAFLVNGSFGDSWGAGISAPTVNGSRGISRGNGVLISGIRADRGSVSNSWASTSDGYAAITSNIVIGSIGFNNSSSQPTIDSVTIALSRGTNDGSGPALRSGTSFLSLGGPDLSTYRYFDNTGAATFP